jgi:hypothetical protein
MDVGITFAGFNIFDGIVGDSEGLLSVPLGSMGTRRSKGKKEGRHRRCTI